jgi:hypothetical protein
MEPATASLSAISSRTTRCITLGKMADDVVIVRVYI